MMLRGDIIELLRKVYDIERLTGKIAYGNANARDMISLRNSLSNLPELKQVFSMTTSSLLKDLHQRLDVLSDIHKLIDDAIVEEPPISVKEGGIIKPGFNEEIDSYRNASTEGKNWIIALEAKEKELTGIKNLKVGYTRVFGYYIEITKSFLNQVPDRYVRKQTLTGGERFITEELKEIENKILGSEEKVINLEYEEFTKIRNEIARNIERLQTTANSIANVDVLTSLAVVADNNNYVYPEVDDGDILENKH